MTHSTGPDDPDPLPTPEQIAERREAAIAAAGFVFAQALYRQAQMTPREQAEAAYTPTGPPVDELEDRIRAERGYPAAGEDGGDTSA